MSDNLQCNYCDKILSSKSALKMHQLTAKYCLALRPDSTQVNHEYECDLNLHLNLNWIQKKIVLVVGNLYCLSL